MYFWTSITYILRIEYVQWYGGLNLAQKKKLKNRNNVDTID